MIMDNTPQLSTLTANAEAELHMPNTPPAGANNNNNNNNSSEKQMPAQYTSLPKLPLKRSFDVAFLMMPDERIKQKQAEKQARLACDNAVPATYATDLSPRPQQQQQQQLHLSTETELFERRAYPQISLRSPRIYDDPHVLLGNQQSELEAPTTLKSAFTKVATTSRLESPLELAPPLSPDQLSCPSMSPPVATTPPRTNSGNGSLSNGSTSSSSALPCLPPNIVYQSFRPDYQFNGAFQSVNQVQVLQAQRLKQQLLYRPSLANSTAASPVASAPTASADFLTGYSSFPFPGAAHHFAGVAPPELPRIVQNPAAAAILSTLIPPTLASTFTLTAQNVCAKCNISFRMTSDLVYHMRSHHKSEVACDPHRRKREEKLKCPVCQESFRERHHLTRHMTAHQDKESDQPTARSNGAASGDLLIMANGVTLNNSRQHVSRVANATK